MNPDVIPQPDLPGRGETTTVSGGQECPVYRGIQSLAALVVSYLDGPKIITAIAAGGTHAGISTAGTPVLDGTYRLLASAEDTAWFTPLEGAIVGVLECAEPVYLVHPGYGQIGIGHGLYTISRVRHGEHGFCREHLERAGGSWPVCDTPVPGTDPSVRKPAEG